MGFLEQGRNDERYVESLLRSKGYAVVRSNARQDMEEHIDLWFRNGASDEWCGIDVKGLKKRSRNDFTASEDDTWVETMNVNGKSGWLYGKAKYIAFRRTGDVVFVQRQKLASHVEEKTRGLLPVEFNPKCHYVPYRRRNRMDTIILVPFEDIEAISEFTIANGEK